MRLVAFGCAPRFSHATFWSLDEKCTPRRLCAFRSSSILFVSLRPSRKNKIKISARNKVITFHLEPRRPASHSAAVSPGNPFLVQLLCSQQRSAGRRVGQGVAWCSVVPVFWGVWAEHTNSPSGLTLEADNCQS